MTLEATISIYDFDDVDMISAKPMGLLMRSGGGNEIAW